MYSVTWLNLGMRLTSRAAVRRPYLGTKFCKLEVHGIKCYNNQGVIPRKHGLELRQRWGSKSGRLLSADEADCTSCGRADLRVECMFLVKCDTQIPDCG